MAWQCFVCDVLPQSVARETKHGLLLPALSVAFCTSFFSSEIINPKNPKGQKYLSKRGQGNNL